MQSSGRRKLISLKVIRMFLIFVILIKYILKTLVPQKIEEIKLSF